MLKPEIKIKDNPEARLLDDIRKFLAVREWVTMRTHGNAHQRGFPDLLALHHVYGVKWVEVKLPTGSIFTPAQMTVFNKIMQTDHGVWVMTAATEHEYAKLHRKPNWVNHVVGQTTRHRGGDQKALLFDIAGTNPEAILQNKIMRAMRERGWHCLPTFGSTYQQGLPDFYALHPEKGAKWVEVKRREAYSFTGAQRKYFPLISQGGHGIWILTAVDEIHLLDYAPNWWQFMYGGMGK